MLSMLRWCWRKVTPSPAPWSRSACRAASLSTCTSPEMSSSWRPSRTIPSARSSGGIWRRCTWKTNYLCYPSSKLLSLKPTLQKKLLYNDGVQVFEADLQCLILSIVIKEFSIQLFTCKSIQQKNFCPLTMHLFYFLQGVKTFVNWLEFILQSTINTWRIGVLVFCDKL